MMSATNNVAADEAAMHLLCLRRGAQSQNPADEDEDVDVALAPPQKNTESSANESNKTTATSSPSPRSTVTRQTRSASWGSRGNKGKSSSQSTRGRKSKETKTGGDDAATSSGSSSPPPSGGNSRTRTARGGNGRSGRSTVANKTPAGTRYPARERRESSTRLSMSGTSTSGNDNDDRGDRGGGQISFAVVSASHLITKFHGSDQLDAEWNRKLSELKSYHAEHGDCSCVPVNSQLGAWVVKQRNQYKRLQNGKRSSMTQERIEMLEGISGVGGWSWILPTTTEKSSGTGRRGERAEGSEVGCVGAAKAKNPPRRLPGGKSENDYSCFVGKPVAKRFDAEVFRGEVTSVESDEDGVSLFRITYTDGDSEDVEWNELEVMIELFRSLGGSGDDGAASTTTTTTTTVPPPDATTTPAGFEGSRSDATGTAGRIPESDERAGDGVGAAEPGKRAEESHLADRPRAGVADAETRPRAAATGGSAPSDGESESPRDGTASGATTTECDVRTRPADNGDTGGGRFDAAIAPSLASGVELHVREKAALEARLDDALRSVENMTAERDALVEELSRAKIERDALSRDGQRASAELMEKIDSLELQKRQVEEAREELRGALRVKSLLVGEKEAIIAEQDEKIGGITARLSESNARLEDQGGLLETLQSKCENAVAASEGLRRELAEASKARSELEVRVRTCEDEVRSLRQSRQFLADAVAQRDALVADLRATVAEKKSDEVAASVTSSSKREESHVVNQLQVEVARYRQELGRSKRRVNELAGQLGVLSNAQESTEQQLASCNHSTGEDKPVHLAGGISYHVSMPSREANRDQPPATKARKRQKYVLL